MITGFVFVMMLIIEYLNVVTRGNWQAVFSNNRWGQYLVAVLFGATPGCLGAFAVVAMYAHGVVSFGALVAAMIATSGDEAFVMFAMIPEKAILLTGILIVVAFLAGWLSDYVLNKTGYVSSLTCDKLVIHETERCDCFSSAIIINQWRQLSLARAALAAFLVMFIAGLATGWIGPHDWDWKRLTITFSVLVGVFIIVTVPEHFLQDHLWKHVARKHTLRIFLWTFGALLVTHLLIDHLHYEEVIGNNLLVVLIIACLIGIIPESGPHLIFVTLFAGGSIPFSVLLASSIVQDGHGMLPLLADSRRAFIVVKAVNLFVGFIVGLAFYLAGW